MDFGFVGDIDSIDAEMVQTYLDAGTVPVISPLGADDDGTVLNINADTIAASLAASLHAEKLILATGALGIFEDINDTGSLISYTISRACSSCGTSGSLADGMLPKAKAIETGDQRRRAARARDFFRRERTACCWRSLPTKEPARWSSRARQH